jgi:hypothetical protein
MHGLDAPADGPISTSSADSVQLPRTYQTGHQRIISWILVLVALASGVFIIVFSIVGPPGVDGYVTGVALFLTAAGTARFATCRLIANDDGVQVVNMSETVNLRWDEIDEFKVSAQGPCRMKLTNGRTLGITGIQQKNISGMLGTHNTPERRMIDELNALLQERSPRPTTR